MRSLGSSLAAVVLLTAGCAAEPDPALANEPVEQAEQGLGGTPATKTKLAAVTAAENQTYTSDGRLFVTGDNGIFELVPNGNGGVTTVERVPKQNCSFGGIVASGGTLYANCYAIGASHIYAAAITAAPSFQRISTLNGTSLANGLTADDAGHLYVASTFLGQILRLTPSATNPLEIASTEVWFWGAGLLTNGIKYAAGSIYWTDGAIVKRAAIKADGTPGWPKILFGALAFFDDLAVDDDGILVADYIGGVIRSYDLDGHATGVIRAGLSGPSSVRRARAPFAAGSLVVTERAGNQVSLVTP